MSTDFASKLAEVLTGYCQPVQPGQLVNITASTEAMPLVEALYAAVLRRGGHPDFTPTFDTLREILFTQGSAEQVAYISPALRARAESANVRFAIHAETNTRAMSQVEPAKMGAFQNAIRPLMETTRAREQAGDYRWCVSAWPTRALAQEAEMGLLAYTDFVYRACGLHHADPLAYWRTLSERQKRIVDWLQPREHLAIKGPGIELSMSVAGRTWISADGHVNFPDGEVFTGPVEDSVNGYVEYNYPTVYLGHRVEGVRLVFKDGAVTEASAAQGDEFLQGQLSLEGARRLGEFAIGTNYDITRFSGSTLFDEKIGGTLHMALGRSYDETGGVNKSATHWDMVMGMQHDATISADGEVFYKDGQFLID